MLKQTRWVFFAIALTLTVYFAAVFCLDYSRGNLANAPQRQDLRSIMGALQDYYVEQGSFPVFPNADIPTSALKEKLSKHKIYVTFKFPEPDPAARYYSDDGKSYALLFHFERAEGGQRGACMIEMGRKATGHWGQPPYCGL